MVAAFTPTELYPLRFHPALKHYPWGGTKLAASLDRDLPTGTIAESWEISGHPDGPTPIANGAYAGLLLTELIDREGERLVGRRNRDALETGRFPLLIKILDAAEWLSVQVHPSDAYALQHEGDLGKTEMWLVLFAEPGAELIQGVKTGVDREAFAQAIETGTTHELLHRVPVAAGDVFFLAPGAIHAIGPGIVLTEIQQSSNVTYRVFDWNRTGTGGTRRQLHIDQALAVADFGIVEPGPATPRPLPEENRPGIQVEELARCEYFDTRKLQLTAGTTYNGDCDGSSYQAWALLEGEVEIRWGLQGALTRLSRIEWILLPAALGPFEVTATEDATLLRVVTPEANPPRNA